MSIDKWMDKDVPHMYSGILLSHKKNEILSCVIQSEVRQKEKNKYHMLTHTYIYKGSKHKFKKNLDVPICKAGMQT